MSRGQQKDEKQEKAIIHIELTCFACKPGSDELVHEWMTMLREHHDAVLETLDPEHMYVESIFTEAVDGRRFLYWLSIQGPGGSQLEESGHWIDKEHMRYWNQCVDESVPPVNLTRCVAMIPERVLAAMVPVAQDPVPASTQSGAADAESAVAAVL